MDILQLRYFIAAAEYQNFTKAAKQFYISQSNISYHISEMEKELGTKLFIRNKSSLELTVSGKTLLEDARQIVDLMEKAIAKTKYASSNFGKLTIGYLNLATIEHVPALIRQWEIRHPNILIDVRQMDVEEINAGVLDGAVDIGFTRFVSLGNSSKFAREKIFDEPLCIVVNEDHALAGKSGGTLDDIKEETIFRFETDTVSMDFGKILGLEQDFPFAQEQIFRVPSLESMFFYIEIGRGIGLIPQSFSSLAPRLHFIPLEGRENSIQWYAIWKNGSDNPYIHPFLSDLKNFYQL